MVVGVVGATGVLVVALMIGLLSARLVGAGTRWLDVVLTMVVGMLVAAIVWGTGLTGIPAPFAATVIAMGGLFGVVVTIHQRVTGAGRIATALFAAVLTAVVFAPLVTIVFALWYDPFATGIGYLDLGAALPVEVAAGAAVFAVTLVDRHLVPPPVAASASRWSLLWPVLLALAGWLVWLSGLELAVDSLTPVILVNTIIMPAAAVLGWAVVERARHRSNTVRGMIYGALAGLAAATPAAGYLIPGLAVLTGLCVGAVSGLLPRRDGATTVGGILLIGGGVSLVLLGVLAKDVSFIYTGQPEVIFGQVLTVAVGLVGGFVLGAAAWAGLRLVRR
jgi:Amt family ammonium transporter